MQVVTSANFGDTLQVKTIEPTPSDSASLGLAASRLNPKEEAEKRWARWIRRCKPSAATVASMAAPLTARIDKSVAVAADCRHYGGAQPHYGRGLCAGSL